MSASVSAPLGFTLSAAFVVAKHVISQPNTGPYLFRVLLFATIESGRLPVTHLLSLYSCARYTTSVAATGTIRGLKPHSIMANFITYVVRRKRPHPDMVMDLPSTKRFRLHDGQHKAMEPPYSSQPPKTPMLAKRLPRKLKAFAADYTFHMMIRKKPVNENVWARIDAASNGALSAVWLLYLCQTHKFLR